MSYPLFNHLNDDSKYEGEEYGQESNDEEFFEQHLIPKSTYFTDIMG